MKKSRPVLVFLIAFSALSIGLYSLRLHAKLNYQGRTLESWLDDLDDDRSSPGLIWRPHPVTDNTRRADAVMAIHAIGTNSLPMLLDRLQTRDRNFPQFINRWLDLLPFKLGNPSRERWTAAMGIQALGPDARSIAPQLIFLSTNSTFAKEACAALLALGPEAEAPLIKAMASQNDWPQVCALWTAGQFPGRVTIPPAAIELCLADKSLSTKVGAAWTVSQLKSSMSELIPALITNLSDPQPLVRKYAAMALGAFGATGKPALNALAPLMNDPDISVRSEASDAIRNIEKSQK